MSNATEIRAGAADVPTFAMVAYDGGLWQPPSGTIPYVLDLTRARDLARPRPAFLDHDRGQVIGHTTAVHVDADGVTAEGVMSGSGPAAQSVAAAGHAGFPWSGELGINLFQKQFVDRGQAAAVNGKTFEGPLYVARDWSPLYVTFCTFDGHGGPVAMKAAGDDWDHTAADPHAEGGGDPAPDAWAGMATDVDDVEIDDDDGPAVVPSALAAAALGVRWTPELAAEIDAGGFSTVDADGILDARHLMRFAVELARKGHHVPKSAGEIEGWMRTIGL